ncbi:MAG: hypothetical protein IJU37_04140 [Desulfovibrio sp.]|nr:hypothetical protein [Desulfovibrio sp.]
MLMKSRLFEEIEESKERKGTKDDKKSELVGQGVGFERTRRITGYLVGTLDRFNNAKRAEERERVKHV